VRQACNAILKHREQIIKWPSIKEQQNISGRIRKAHSFILHHQRVSYLW